MCAFIRTVYPLSGAAASDEASGRNLFASSLRGAFKKNLMGIRSKIAVLPAAVRTELDRLIVERAFSGYQALAEWLQAQGYRISDDSVQRYGVRLRHQLDAIKLADHQARAFAAAGKR